MRWCYSIQPIPSIQFSLLRPSNSINSFLWRRGPDGVPEWGIVELQGDLEARGDANILGGQFIGDLHYDLQGQPVSLAGSNAEYIFARTFRTRFRYWSLGITFSTEKSRKWKNRLQLWRKWRPASRMKQSITIWRSWARPSIERGSTQQSRSKTKRTSAPSIKSAPSSGRNWFSKPARSRLLRTLRRKCRL